MKKHIVIIEDDKEILFFLKLILQERGFKVTAFEALQSIDDLLMSHTDCFILDEQVPVISGHILCTLLKMNIKTKHIPVILISALPEINKFAMLGDADGVLEKPFDGDELLKLVDSVLTRDCN